MSLDKTIDQDLISAMKSKNMEKLSVLRMVKAAIGNYKIDKRKEVLEDAEVFDILQKQVKQRKESFESFQKAGRQDLAMKEEREMVLLQEYLPKALSDEEIMSLATDAVRVSGAKTKAELGKVMKELMPAVKGKADGKRVNEIVLALLA